VAGWIGVDEYGQHTTIKTKALAMEGFHFHYVASLRHQELFATPCDANKQARPDATTTLPAAA
jgi:hypothetical protein